jgi:hypothetical protein
MSFRTTALLFGVMLGVLWLFGLMLTYQRTRLDEGFLLPTLAKDRTAEIDTVTVEREGHKYTFFKTARGWRLRLDDYPQELRAEDSKVDDIVRDLRGARKTEEADVTRNLAQWGLDKPVEKVILKQKGGGKEWVVNVGKEDPAGGYVYVNSSDHPEDVLAVRRARLKVALITPENINEYRSRQLLDVSDMTARRLDLKPAADTKGRELVLEKGKEAVWLFKKPPYGPAEYEGEAAAKEPTGVRGLINTLRSLQVEKDADFEPLSTKAFPADRATLTVQVERSGAPGEAVKETLLIGPKAPPRKGVKGEKDGEEQYFARLAEDQAVVRVGARNVETLLAFTRKPDVLRSHDLAQVPTGKPDVVRVSSGKGGGDVVTLYKPAFDWRVVQGPLKHKANESAVQGPNGLLTTLQGKNQVKDFFDVDDEAKEGKAKDKDLGLDSPTATVSVWVDGLEKAPVKGKEDKKEAKKGEKDGAKKEDKKAEPPADEGPKINPKVKPALTLTFGKKAGDLIYVKRELADGAVSRVSVPAALLQKIVPPEGALAYLDPNVAPFLEADVARLVLKIKEDKGERTFVVERAGEKKDKGPKTPLIGDWLLLEPKDLKDRPNADADAVQNLLTTLTRLAALKFVAKVEGKKELGKYGLEPPAATVAVTLKKKGGEKEPKALTYLFGNEEKADKARKPGVYTVMTSGDLKDIVFETDPVTLASLKGAELRDRTVFRFTRADVKEIRMTIRKKDIPTVSPVFVRKGKTWEVGEKSLLEFNLDPAAVDQLLLTLSNLKALRYVSFAGPKEEQGLTKAPPLEITVVMADGKTKHELKVGAAEGTAGYYAEAPELPRAVFLVAMPHFQALMDQGVNYFRQK